MLSKDLFAHVRKFLTKDFFGLVSKCELLICYQFKLKPRWLPCRVLALLGLPLFGPLPHGEPRFTER
jgi:hypothetical protein